ncbi:hypothetical protein GCM10007886_28790 [Methylobacterium gregans]|nr:hypothetical protein GCM10007886_28790 [Methylobacterium gregans]
MTNSVVPMPKAAAASARMGRTAERPATGGTAGDEAMRSIRKDPRRAGVAVRDAPNMAKRAPGATARGGSRPCATGRARRKAEAGARQPGTGCGLPSALMPFRADRFDYAVSEPLISRTGRRSPVP